MAPLSEVLTSGKRCWMFCAVMAWVAVAVAVVVGIVAGGTRRAAELQGINFKMDV